ncbi:MAG: RNase P subunit p30 family protein [Candidatus Micrarchaeota archaeon]
MKKFVDVNIGSAALRSKALSLGFSDAFLSKVIEGSTVDELVRQLKRKGSPELVNPLSAQDFYKSSALIETAAEHLKTFEIPLSYLLHSSDKSKLMFQLRIFLKNCTKRGVKLNFSSRARDEFGLKSPREIIAISQVLGLTYEQAAAALQIEGEIK